MALLILLVQLARIGHLINKNYQIWKEASGLFLVLLPIVISILALTS